MLPQAVSCGYGLVVFVQAMRHPAYTILHAQFFELVYPLLELFLVYARRAFCRSTMLCDKSIISITQEQGENYG